MRTVARALALGAVMVVVLAVPVAGGSLTTVLDPVGDTAQIGGVRSTPAFLDMVSVSVTRQATRFEFSMTVAATVPSQPALPSQVKETWWMWALDTDPATFPFGFPRAPGLAFPPEFAVAVSWNGSAFTAFVVDRRPTLSGGEPLFTPVAFDVKGTNVTTIVNAATIGDPASLRFSALTRVWMGGPGTEGFIFTDYLGTPGTFHPWPS